MTAAELDDEGWKLSRPCVFLRDTGPKGDLGAVWGGDGIVPAPKKGTFRHRLTVNCFWYK